MANYSMLTIRVPAEVEKLLNKLGNATEAYQHTLKSIEENDAAFELALREETDDSQSINTFGEAYTNERERLAVILEGQELDIQVAALNVGNWWRAVNLPF